jgi:CRP/FNR family transcriptional regulator, cyclic AMP receptor protein
MHVTLPAHIAADISALQHSVATAQSLDALHMALPSSQWLTLGQYLQPFQLASGQVLIQQGAQDRTVYFVESGTLSVHFEDGRQRLRLAMIGAGSVVGEGAFFSHQVRSATVQAGGDCALWGLAPMRFTELTNRHPGIALALVQALGGVLARRSSNKPKRTAIT